MTSFDSEVLLISSVLKNPSLLERVATLQPEAFSSRPHQRLWSILLSLREDGAVIEPALVVQKAASLGWLREIGGEDYLKHLLSLQPIEENLLSYADSIFASYRVTQLTNLLSDVGDVTPDNVEEKLDFLINRLDDLRRTPLRTESSLHELLDVSFQELLQKIENPGIRGHRTGLPSLDVATGGYMPGELWVVGARPGQGKTSFACSSILALASSGVPSLLFSREMARQPLVERLLSIYSGVPLFSLRTGLVRREDFDKIYEAANTLRDFPIFIDLNFSADISYTEGVIRQHVREKGVKVVFLDYIQIVAERSSEQTHELGRISRRLKLLANSLNVTIVVLSQLNREVEHRDNKRPSLADLRQSGNLEEDADCVLGLYRDDYYKKESKDKGKLEIIILKQRNGPTGTIVVNFDNLSTKVFEHEFSEKGKEI